MAWSKTPANERGYGWQWKLIRDRVMLRDSGLCQLCAASGRVQLAHEVDHITPKAKGGTDEEGNLQALCSPCHQRKTIEETGRRVKPQIGADGWPIA